MYTYTIYPVIGTINNLAFMKASASISVKIPTTKRMNYGWYLNRVK
jgi:hypothetical protein